jgi:hypothetical protein
MPTTCRHRRLNVHREDTASAPDGTRYSRSSCATGPEGRSQPAKCPSGSGACYAAFPSDRLEVPGSPLDFILRFFQPEVSLFAKQFDSANLVARSNQRFDACRGPSVRMRGWHRDRLVSSEQKKSNERNKDATDNKNQVHVGRYGRTVDCL